MIQRGCLHMSLLVSLIGFLLLAALFALAAPPKAKPPLNAKPAANQSKGHDLLIAANNAGDEDKIEDERKKGPTWISLPSTCP